MRYRMHGRSGAVARHLVAVALLALLGGCNWSDLVTTDLPPTTADPEALKTQDGALSVYHGAIHGFRKAFGGSNAYIVASGRFTDELQSGAYTAGGQVLPIVPGGLPELDSRDMPEDQVLRSWWVESWYRNMNLARNQTVDGIFYLRNYAPLLPKDLVGHMFAIRGLTLIHLADMFCSGIPLTHYKTAGGFTYEAGLPTDSVYARAVTWFDSALTTVPDSANYRYLAEVGRARALLNLGKFTEAAASVQDVPTDFVYLARYAEDYNGSFSNNWVWNVRSYQDPEGSFGTIGDSEGGNGLPFASANDPRVPVIPAPMQNQYYPLTNYVLPAWMFPAVPPWNGTSTEAKKNAVDIPVASGIEARLTEAEAAAAAGDGSFLGILNALRTTCTDVASCPAPAPAGTGGVAGLPPLVDPGSKETRIKMVFDERAYWLFLTGHRQGDLRRLVRVYGWPQDQVYPSGYFPFGGSQKYGTYTNIPIPNSERAINTTFTGCINRDA